MSVSPDEHLRITYHLTCGPGEDAGTTARDIALEQTVELPAACVPAAVERDIVGVVENVEPLGGSRWRAVIAYPAAVVGGEIPQCLNLLFGNISLKRDILVTEIQWPATLLERLEGPRLGIAGIRELCGRTGSPLLCAALKPVGLLPQELADLCFQFAAGGIDVIKDDHGLADQRPAPFKERVECCLEAVGRANARTGGGSLYFPNLTGPVNTLEDRVQFLESVGCRGVLLSPLLVGPDTIRWIADRSGFAILAHPALAGAFFGDTHGIAPEQLLGTIFRIIGSDGVIYPNVGGRFWFSSEVCDAINQKLREPLGSLRPSFPVPGGGIDVERVPHWVDRYGADTIFLIGSSLYARSDLEKASAQLVTAVRDHVDTRRVEGR